MLPAGIIKTATTNKARYSPGENVFFRLQLEEATMGASLQVSYFHLNEKIDNQAIAVTGNLVSWNWQPPQTDFRGYLAEIILLDNGIAQDTSWIAADVSSSWTRFPRYGFLSKYSYLNTAYIENIIADLNRYHINGLQFYDWHYKHHMPLKGTPENPEATW